MTLAHRDYSYLGLTQSLCPACLAVVPAKIITRRNRVYFRKTCPVHGVRDDFVCSDRRWYDRMDYSLPGKQPVAYGVAPQRGCPYDCGLCTEHEQHTCIALFEITSSCNLKCPICFASSGPAGTHVPIDECRSAIDRLVDVEGRPEVLQLSGGEPTIHPHFLSILDYACSQPIDIVMINTNGIRFARDPDFLAEVAQRERVEVYLQFDSLSDDHYPTLRGESLLETKLAAVDALSEAGFHVTLVCTLQSGVNDDQVGPLIQFAADRPQITGVSFQPTTYSGRHFLPEDLEQRITFPDVIRAAVTQTDDWFRETDFFPLPCAHPNGHSLTFAYRSQTGLVPLTRWIDIEQNLDLLANGITFTRERARQLIEFYLGRCCSASEGPSDGCQGATLHGQSANSPRKELTSAAAAEFFTRAVEQTLDQTDVLRITVTSFMDAYNFDVRQLMKSCVHHLLPSGHLIPFSAYNVLYREGHVPLPSLTSPARSTHNVRPVPVDAPV